jgi:hypothetical protein
LISDAIEKTKEAYVREVDFSMEIVFDFDHGR